MMAAPDITRRNLLTRAGILAGAALLPAGRLLAHDTTFRPRILCFGDSLMAGYGLAPPDRLPAQLARWFETQGFAAPVMQVAAISGDTSYGGRVRIRPALRRTAPDATIVEIGANDMLLRLSAQRAEANLDYILTHARAGKRPVLLAGIGAVGGTESFRAGWNAIWPRLARRHGCLLIRDLYAPIRAAGADERKALLQEDGLHASPAGTAAMIEAAAPQFRALISKAVASRRPG